MDIEEFRKLGHHYVDYLSDYLSDIDDRPLFPDIQPKELEAMFDEPVPTEGISAEQITDELNNKLFPYCSHVNHPGYFGLITPTPTPVGILGDFIAAALNQNLGAYTIGPSAVTMERQTIRWLNDLVGYGDGAGGNLTSGGMTANFIGLKLARDKVSNDRIQHEGVRDRWAVYVSEERHVSIDKAVDGIGIGREGLRILPTDEHFSVRLDALEQAIQTDHANGIKPLCVIGLAGTTNTGSLDALPDLHKIARREKIWLHVDAAYGGGMLLSNENKGYLKGIEQADSVTIDPHKWFYAPLDAGAILVKDAARLTASFGMQPAYLTDETDEEGERYQYYVHGFEQSRRFRSLKIWMGFKRYGTKQMGQWVDANIRQAKHLYTLAENHPNFKSAVAPAMSAICIQYCHETLDANHLNHLHGEVARRIEQGGQFWISTTVLKRQFYFRINPVNFRTKLSHMDQLFDVIIRECEAVREDIT